MSYSLEQRKKKVLKELASNPVVQVACVRAGVSRATIYRWMKEDSFFMDAVEDAKEKGYEMTSDMAESQILKKIKDGHFSAAKFWLETHNKRYSRKNQNTDEQTEKQVGWGELVAMAMDRVEEEKHRNRKSSSK